MIKKKHLRGDKKVIKYNFHSDRVNFLLLLLLFVVYFKISKMNKQKKINNNNNKFSFFIFSCIVLYFIFIFKLINEKVRIYYFN